MTAVSVSLPATKTIESSIILLDAVATTLLLVLCRVSGRIFDDVLGTPKLLNQAVKRIVDWAAARPAIRREQDEDVDLPLGTEGEEKSESARGRTSGTDNQGRFSKSRRLYQSLRLQNFSLGDSAIALASTA